MRWYRAITSFTPVFIFDGCGWMPFNGIIRQAAIGAFDELRPRSVPVARYSIRLNRVAVSTFSHTQRSKRCLKERVRLVSKSLDVSFICVTRSVRQYRSRQVNIVQASPGQLRAQQVGPIKIGATKICMLQARETQVRHSEVCASNVRARDSRCAGWPFSGSRPAGHYHADLRDQEPPRPDSSGAGRRLPNSRPANRRPEHPRRDRQPFRFDLVC